jgi:hypothetical protein
MFGIIRPVPTRVKHLSDVPLYGRLLALLQTLDFAGKACQGQTLQLIMKILKLWTRKFYNTGPSRVIPKSTSLMEEQ